MLDKIEGVEIFRNVCLKDFTTFRIGGNVDKFVRIYSEEGLRDFIKFCYSEGIDFFLLGGGSNVLIRDGRIDDFIVVKLEGEFRSVKFSGDGEWGRVFVGAGYSLPAFSKVMLNYLLEGAEFCIGIPGSVGGGVVMNAGAHGNELKDIVSNVFCFSRNGEKIVFSKDEISFSYRDSSLKGYIVTFVEFRLRGGIKEKIKERINEYLMYRSSTQPRGFSAGSVFKNPENTNAWKLIREVGLAGYRIGDVMFSEKHSNFIVNLGNGKAEDVLELIKIARKRVFESFGITFEPEIKLVGLSLEE